MHNKHYEEVLSLYQQKLDISAKQIRNLIPTSGEIGTLIEEMFRSYLIEALPEKIGVSHGFVMESNNGKSQQMDIILYDRMDTPLFLQVLLLRFSLLKPHMLAGRLKRN